MTKISKYFLSQQFHLKNLFCLSRRKISKL